MIQTQISSLPSTINVLEEFPAWIVQYCNPHSVVLDVGAGSGRTGNPMHIRPHIARLVGVDPDDTITRNPYLDERYQLTLEDFSRDCSTVFDCMYTTFVIEHITSPHIFLQACRSLLKPGGMFFGITPNLWHYFGMITKMSATLGIEDWLLKRLIGAQAQASYHFPTTYRLNSISAIRHALEQNGFREVEFKCADQTNRFESYFPKLLRWFPGVYSRSVYMLNLPQVMGLIMFRATV